MPKNWRKWRQSYPLEWPTTNLIQLLYLQRWIWSQVTTITIVWVINYMFHAGAVQNWLHLIFITTDVFKVKTIKNAWHLSYYIPSISLTGGHGESFSNSLLPWGENFALPGVGESNPDCSFTCFCNDGLCNDNVDGKLLFSFEPLIVWEEEITAIDCAGFLERGWRFFESCSLADTLDFEPEQKPLGNIFIWWVTINPCAIS